MATVTWRTSGGKWRLACDLVLSSSGLSQLARWRQCGRRGLGTWAQSSVTPCRWQSVSRSVQPIIATILMLLSPKAKVTGAGFLLGCLAGILVAVVLLTVLSSALPQQDSAGSSPVSGHRVLHRTNDRAINA